MIRYIKLLLVVMVLMPMVTMAAGNFVVGNDVAQFVDTNFGSLKMNLQNTANGLTVTTTDVTGYAWGDVMGWINFGPFTNNSQKVSVACSAGVGTLSGYAWGTTAGWVNFGPFTNTATQQVTIDVSGGLTGYAWAQNGGWIDFAGTKTTFTCPTTVTVSGCTNASATNYNPAATVDDGSCVYPGPGSTPSRASCTLTATPGIVATAGQAVTLSWTLSGTNPKTLTLLGQTYTSSGSIVVTPTTTTTYTATATNAQGSRNCTDTVLVDEPVNTVLACTQPGALNHVNEAAYPAGTNFVDNGRCVFLNSPDQVWDLEYVPVLDGPARSDQCSYFKQYLKKGSRGQEVAKVQYFLNEYMNAGLTIDGVYGKTTVAAVHAFQRRHFEETIAPWHPPLPLRTTGRWYKTTMGTANIIVGCPEDKVFIEDRGIFYSFSNSVGRLLNTFFSSN